MAARQPAQEREAERACGDRGGLMDCRPSRQAAPRQPLKSARWHVDLSGREPKFAPGRQRGPRLHSRTGCRRSSAGQSTALVKRGSWVRIPSSALGLRGSSNGSGCRGLSRKMQRTFLRGGGAVQVRVTSGLPVGIVGPVGSHRRREPWVPFGLPVIRGGCFALVAWVWWRPGRRAAQSASPPPGGSRPTGCTRYSRETPRFRKLYQGRAAVAKFSCAPARARVVRSWLRQKRVPDRGGRAPYLRPE